VSGELGGFDGYLETPVSKVFENAFQLPRCIAAAGSRIAD
jgi:hypothetical protein